MAKIIQATAPKTTRDAARGVKQTRAPDGGLVKTVAADSPTLSSDLGYVFKSNVRKVSGKR